MNMKIGAYGKINCEFISEKIVRKLPVILKEESSHHRK